MNERDELWGDINKHVSIAGNDMVKLVDALLAAGYRKVELTWADTLTNDGTYEYTISSDCDGSNVKHWRRVPGLTYEGQASPWKKYDPEAAA